MNGSSPRAMRFLRCVASLPIMINLGFIIQSATAQDQPAWKKGRSTWNGESYEVPKIPGKAPRFTLPIAEDIPRPYTIPTDPNAASAAQTMSAKHFAENPAAPEIMVSETKERALPQAPKLTLPAGTARTPRQIIPSNPNVSTGDAEPWQTQLQFPEDQATPQPASSSETGALSPATFSSLPSNALNDFLSTDPVSLNGQRPDDSNAEGMPLPSSQVGQVPNTQPTQKVSEQADSKSGQEPESSADASSKINSTTPGLDSSEPAPLQTEVTRWYQYPRGWMKGWDSHAEFGLDGSDGNANTLAMQAGVELKRKTERYTLGMDINYRQASSRNKTTEQNGRFNLNFDRLLGNTSWSAFAKHGMEWDQFKPFDLRLNLNGGVGYYWLRSDIATFATRFGAGASREIGAPIDEWTPEAVFGMEAEKQLTSRQKLKGKFDYFPAWENFGDYRLVSDVSWEILLDGSENLSLKLAATDRYDSTPQGAKPNDIYYSLLLLYKF